MSLVEPTAERAACGIGFVAQLHGERSHALVADALEILARLEHRAGAGRDPDTGDGAGILLQVPHAFLQRSAGLELPARGAYGVGMLFLPPEEDARAACERILAEVIESEGQRLLGFRDVPVVPERLGWLGRAVAPSIRQVFVARRRVVPSAFERKLYRIRKLTENRVRASGADPARRFHVASLSSETLVYKGLCLPRQLPAFYPDLTEPLVASALALVHSRFSTNTFPTWDLAQPFRHIAHNGEINTLRGNRAWMQARRGLLQTARLGGSLEPLWPLIGEGSDSFQFDNVVELLHLAGRTLPQALMLMIPPAWEHDPSIPEDRRAFHAYTSSLLEPWDGPAAIAFTDGRLIGATLDRNGLRPARFLLTDDDRVILASEAGVIDVPPSRVVRRGRLTPGKMLLVDTDAGRLVEAAEIEREATSRWPYRRWLHANVFELSDLPPAEAPALLSPAERRRQLRALGWTDEDRDATLAPMVKGGKEPVGSMGRDIPLAVFSDRAPPLFEFFHQLFAQVTNPAIDPYRESLVMSLATALGPEGNTFEETPEQCHRLALPSPVLRSAELARLVEAGEDGPFEVRRLSTLYPVDGDLRAAVDALTDAALAAVDEGAGVLVLGDRGVDASRVAIPALLALSAVHHRLVREGTRMFAGLLVESGEIREVHDVACLFGHGASAVNPWLALELARELSPEDPDAAEGNLVHAYEDGLRKVMSKMGISTLQSYRGAQLFEAVGLGREVMERCFPGTPSRVGGLTFAELHEDVRTRHARGFGVASRFEEGLLPVGGRHRWRRRGEPHRWNPATIADLQDAVRRDDADVFARYTRRADDEERQLFTLRGLLEIDAGSVPPVPLSEVEPARAIVKRFVTGAMSFGSIGAAAHETLAIAMNRLGGRSNSGEGGEEPRRFLPDASGDLRRSAIKQVASGRFGVTTSYLVNADELQIKIAQGAKPGEGGQLPGHKVDERIAKVRWSTPGVTLISPPPHHDIYSIEDLAQLVWDLQSVNPSARVSVKLVSEIGVGTIAAGVAKTGAGGVVIAGFEGGTGASPVSSIQHAGLPWELGLAETQQVLVQNGLRDRLRVQVDGGIRTARDVLVATLLGAEEFGMATASLIATGCMMLRKCHLNTCSVGIATQDEELQARFAGKPEHVERFFLLLAEDLRRRMAALGARTLDELVGRVDLLRVREVDHPRAKLLDLSAVLAAPRAPASEPRRCDRPQRKDVSSHLDHVLLRDAAPLGSRVELRRDVRNVDRAVGALLSGTLERAGLTLDDDTIRVRLSGSAGQSFGAFLTQGVTLELQGEANDYVAKGLSGGRVIVFPPPQSTYRAEDEVIAGNTVLYGATRGELYLRGRAGERFAVRNSGATAVVEGVGDHGCEYMTGGTVVVLGSTGRNFGAGMSGGLAYVLDGDGAFATRCNREMVELLPLLDLDEIRAVAELVERHRRFTGSELAARLLASWPETVSRFVKVLPTDYRRVLQARAASAPLPAPAPVRLYRVGS